ncbi:hypothetical protein F511_15110 [Dorcoceras hygrometricum]|uniref:Integrase catalytic domain-containing protein n=1 Tax=Dorcoceras hygrometricum TaxID=472368 RepID=A0A2Z7BYC1_9LAMI|nr:hypothetical protein F511_15110 [Dorcoceras hygrometricum]
MIAREGCGFFLLKQKSDALNKFQEWHKFTEKHTGLKVKTLRTDNGLEFCSREFDEYCKGSGIARHLTVPGTLQQNGVAERMNRTLLERVRCMLSHSGLSKGFWAEAVVTAAYIINRCPSTAIELKTHVHKWNGEPQTLDNLRVFGCEAYAHVKQGKLEARAVRCVFLGYPEGVKGYKLWCIEPGQKKTIISRDVTFNEIVFPLKPNFSDTYIGDSNLKTSTTRVEVELPVNQSETEGGAQSELSGHDTEEETGVDDYQLTRDRQRRAAKPTQRYGYADLITFALNVASDVDKEEPATVSEALNSQEREKWQRAMEEEMNSLMKNRTWELVPKPVDQRVIGCKWIFKKKDGISGD